MYTPSYDPEARRYYVYGVLCQERDSSGEGFIKFGYSSNIQSRIAQIRQGCPIPARYFVVIETQQNKRSAIKVENYLLGKFESRRTKGEWFKFDFSNPNDKMFFNLGCKEVFADCSSSLRDEWWTKISIPALDQYHASKRSAWMRRNHFNHARAHQRRDDAKEYLSFRG